MLFNVEARFTQKCVAGSYVVVLQNTLHVPKMFRNYSQQQDAATRCIVISIWCAKQMQKRFSVSWACDNTIRPRNYRFLVRF